MTAAAFSLACVATAWPGIGQPPRMARQQLVSAPSSRATVDISGDAHLVAFTSSARLDPRDTNRVDDVYVLDRRSGRITLESVAADGSAANGSSNDPRLSHDGRFLVFSTVATNVAGRAAGPSSTQVVRRDRATSMTTLVSRTPANSPGNGASDAPDISDDGRFVVFQSAARDIADGVETGGGGSSVYRYDATSGAVVRIAVTVAGRALATARAWMPRISGDGRYVVFTASSAAPSPGRPAFDRQVYLHDAWRVSSRRLTQTDDGGSPDGASYEPAINGDGHFVAFVSTATNLAGHRGRVSAPAVFLLDASSGRSTLVSRAGRHPADGASRHPALSTDGRYVVYASEASNLVCTRTCAERDADLNLVSDIYRADTVSNRVERVSGRVGQELWWTASTGPSIDASGHVIAFSSRHPIDATDLGHDDDLFIEDLGCPPLGR